MFGISAAADRKERNILAMLSMLAKTSYARKLVTA
jgi:hypothetical protein